MRLEACIRTAYGDRPVPADAAPILERAKLRSDGQPDRRTREGKAFMEIYRRVQREALAEFERGVPC